MHIKAAKRKGGVEGGTCAASKSPMQPAAMLGSSAARATASVASVNSAPAHDILCLFKVSPKAARGLAGKQRLRPLPVGACSVARCWAGGGRVGGGGGGGRGGGQGRARGRQRAAAVDKGQNHQGVFRLAGAGRQRPQPSDTAVVGRALEDSLWHRVRVRHPDVPCSQGAANAH